MTKYVDNQIEKRQYFRDLVVEHPRLNLVCEPEYLNVCFQVIPKNESLEIDQFNIDLRFKMVKQGRFLVNFSSDKDGTFYFRLVFANGVTEKEDIKYFIDELLKLAD